ncbi:MAG: PIG-L family deacetylase [Anaerolineae bacterium]
MSPHIDDVVLSCGATIRRLTANGESVLILTVTAGDPPNPLPDSPAIQELHERWAAGVNPYATRRTEDVCAAGVIGAHVYHMPLADCIYRTDEAGKALYLTFAEVFGAVHPDDPMGEILAKMPLPSSVTESAELTLYIPLGVGGHVDHQITRDWGLQLHQQFPTWKVRFYEEYPYCRDEIATERALEYFMWNEIRLDTQIFWVSESEVNARIQASTCYTSQISSFWNSEAALAQETRQVMLRAGRTVLAERFWHESD